MGGIGRIFSFGRFHLTIFPCVHFDPVQKNASIEDMLDCSGQDASVKDLLDIYGPGSDSHPKSSNVTRSDDFNYTRFYEGYIAVLAQQTMETYLSSSINKVLGSGAPIMEAKEMNPMPLLM